MTPGQPSTPLFIFCLGFLLLRVQRWGFSAALSLGVRGGCPILPGSGVRKGWGFSAPPSLSRFADALSATRECAKLTTVYCSKYHRKVEAGD
jgi:hypothetical protein